MPSCCVAVAAVLSPYVLVSTGRSRIALALGLVAVLALLGTSSAGAAGRITALGAEPSQQWHHDFDLSWPLSDDIGIAGPTNQPPPQVPTTVVLGPGEYFSVGQSATSPNGWYRLALEPDGRLVLRATDDGLGLYGALWSTGPYEPRDPDHPAMPLLVMRADGELALYDTAHLGFGEAGSSGEAAQLWTTDTRSESGASLLLGDDGVMSVVTPQGQALWRSGNAAPDVGITRSRHVIYDRGGQWVWLVGADGSVIDSYPVSGHSESPAPGRYTVTSKSEDAISYNWLVTMEHMVRFTTDEDGDWIGFHSIPRGWKDRPVQSEADLGEFGSLGCVRQRDDKAERLYEWASIGTPVVVLA